MKHSKIFIEKKNNLSMKKKRIKQIHGFTLYNYGNHEKLTLLLIMYVTQSCLPTKIYVQNLSFLVSQFGCRILWFFFQSFVLNPFSDTFFAEKFLCEWQKYACTPIPTHSASFPSNNIRAPGPTIAIIVLLYPKLSNKCLSWKQGSFLHHPHKKMQKLNFQKIFKVQFFHHIKGHGYVSKHEC